MARAERSPSNQDDETDEVLIARLKERGYSVQVPTTTVTISLPVLLKKKVSLVAGRLNVSVSEAMRQATEDWLKKVGVALMVTALGLACIDSEIVEDLSTLTLLSASFDEDYSM
jgi:hypothetical protein